MARVKRHRSSKRGRNDPCHCGSGRKYKRCCMDKDRALTPPTHVMLADLTSVQLNELVAERQAEFVEVYKKPVQYLRRKFAAQIQDGLDGREAAEALEQYLEQVEARIVDIASRRSRIFWLHVSRRIPPNPLDGVSAWTARLYRTIFSLAILKHGKPFEGTDELEEDAETGTLVPKDLTFEDACDIYNLEYLALEYNRAATVYRRVCKGAVLRPIGQHSFDAVASSELENLMQLVDRRVSRYYNVFSPYGSSLDISAAAIRGEAQAKRSVLFVAALNVEGNDLPDAIKRTLYIGFTDKMNYVIAPLNVAPIQKLLTLFEDQIVNRTGFTPKKILAFTSAIGLRELRRTTDDRRWIFQLFQRAYWITQQGEALENVLSEIASIYADILSDGHGHIDFNTSLTEVKSIFAALTYSDEDIRHIDLADKVARKLILREGDYFIWDYSNILPFLQSLMYDVAFLDGGVANVKSDNFEQEVIALFAATEGLLPWESRRELVAPDGTKRQIDASFVAGSVLYVVECKAFSANRRVARGEWAAMQNRWETLKKYLDQARTLLEFLVAHPLGNHGSYHVPADVVDIEYCLCTPLPEYIPEISDAFWFDDETPRICTPEELIDFVSGQKRRLPTVDDIESSQGKNEGSEVTSTLLPLMSGDSDS